MTAANVWPNGLRTIPRVTSEYMDPDYDGPHYGIDIVDFPINLSIGSGVVTYAQYNPSGAGNEARVQLSKGLYPGDVVRQLHNASLLCKVGQKVVAKTKLGVQGMTGLATGKHDHLEFWLRGDRGNTIDPRIYMAAFLKLAPPGIPTDENGNIMDTIQIHYSKAGKTTRALVTPGTGYFLPWSENGAAIANGLATALKTGNSVPVTESMYDAFQKAAIAMQPKAPSK